MNYNNNRFVKIIKDKNKGVNDIDKLIDELKMTCEESIEIQDLYENFKLNFGKHNNKTLKTICKNEKPYLLWLSKEIKKKNLDIFIF